MKRIFLLVIIGLLLIPFDGDAQISKANKHFLLYEYSMAIPIYEKIIEKEKAGYTEAIPKLADSYRLINDFKKAELWYSRAVKNENIDPITYFHYGQVLRTNEKYDLAASQFRKYSNLYASDPRGKIYAEYCENIQQLDESEETYTIKNMAKLNSEFAEFSPIYYDKGIVFSGNRIIDESSRRDKWAGAAYISFFYSPFLSKNYREFPGFRDPEHIFPHLDNGYHVATCSFDKDFSVMYFTRTSMERVKKDDSNIRTNILKIFYCNNVGGEWSSPEGFYLNNNNYSLSHPSLSSDGSRLYFASDMPGGFGETDIYVCVKEEDGSWSAPVNLGPSVNTFGKEQFPVIHNDSLLYFASDGHFGYGGFDIVEAKRVSDAKWIEVRTLPAPLNSSYDDFGLIIDQSNNKGLFSSNRKEGRGGDDIYAFHVKGAEVKPEPEPEPVVVVEPELEPEVLSLEIAFKVKEKESLQPIPQATLFLINDKTATVTILESNSFGISVTPVDPSTPYRVKAMKDGYLVDCTSFNVGAEEVTPVRDLLLPSFTLNEVFEVKNIYYDFDKSFIRKDAEVELIEVVNLLNDNPITIELGSHTDSRGNDAYNQALSQRRADAAVAWIVNRGIDPNRIIARGYGESQLTNRCSNGVTCSDEEHQANRRTEIKITGIVKQQIGQYDSLKGFKPGQTYPLSYFPDSFFKNCQ